MPVLLRRTDDLPSEAQYDNWCAIGLAPDLDQERRQPNIARRLEKAFEECRETWWDLARRLAATGSSKFSHAVTCAPPSSDMGTSLSWARLVEGLAAQPATVLVVCDDPWLFRHLARVPGVEAGRFPSLWPIRLRLKIRGVAARLRVAFRVGVASVVLRQQRRAHAAGGTFVLVYGHPASRADGHDAYFGRLLIEESGVSRLLHTDCGPSRARELGRHGRTASLHAWGNLWLACRAAMACWRPSRSDRTGPYGWLVRQAADHEAGGGSAAMTAWQNFCQERWLRVVRPRVVTWPWENHPWERTFIRRARDLGTRTVGYQHTVVGRHRYNESPGPLPNGVAGLPDRIICNGVAGASDLRLLGVPTAHLAIGGAFRFQPGTSLPYASDGAVFVALPTKIPACTELIAAARRAACHGFRFIVKSHPMYPFAFEPSPAVQPTSRSMLEYREGLRAVVSLESAVGLEAALAGIPFVRFMTSGFPAIDILPSDTPHVTADADTLIGVLSRLTPLAPLPWSRVFTPVDKGLWRSELQL